MNLLSEPLEERARQALATEDSEAIPTRLHDMTPPLPRAPASLLPTKAAGPEYELRYKLTQLHARGGIGQVWLAYDESVGRNVAWKELLPETVDHASARQRFLHEARLTGQLEHPGIVPVYDLGVRSGEQPYYVMRFVKGRTLGEASRQYHERRRKNTAGPLDLRTLVQALAQVCNTVAYAHSQNVLHRDLKGANVLLGDFGEVLVLDWGLARRIGTDAGESAKTTSGGGINQTLEGQVLGTPGFMAPEQAAGQVSRLDVRTDIYGLGAILYEILTDRPPHSGKDVNEVLRQAREASPNNPGRSTPRTPPALEAICLKALARDPASRYQTASAMADDVQRWLGDEPVSVHREPIVARLVCWARRHRSLVAGMIVLLISVTVALGVGTALVNKQKARAEENLHRAEEQETRAEANLHHALQAVDRFYVQVSENRLLNEPGLQPLRLELLRSAHQFAQQFVQENQSDTARQEDLGKVLILLARISAETGSPADAADQYRRAGAIFQHLADHQPNVPAHRARLASCFLGLGVLAHREAPQQAERGLSKGPDTL